MVVVVGVGGGTAAFSACEVVVVDAVVFVVSDNEEVSVVSVVVVVSLVLFVDVVVAVSLSPCSFSSR